MIDRLMSTLELDLKLLHSTETDASVVDHHHEAFTAFLDVLGRHVQRPHVQQYSELNRDEFVRAEMDYLSQYFRQLSAMNDELRQLLLISGPSYAPQYSIAELTRRMEETRRTGRPKQFAESQRATILRIVDPVQYYGKRIAEELFDSSAAVDGDGAAGREPSAHPGTTAESDEMALSLLRMKVQVIVDRLVSFGGAGKPVLATALLKVKSCMADDGCRLLDPRGGGIADAVARGTVDPCVELVSAEPRDLIFVYHGRAGRKAVFHCGVSNETLHRYASRSGLPLLEVPVVSVLLIDENRLTVGSAHVTAMPSGEDRLSQLALLIKSLDFTNEFMTLASRSDTAADLRAEAAEAEAALLNLAEEL